MHGKLLVSERLYEALLYLYPKKFRAVYGQQMCLTFRDACRVAYSRKGTGGLLALWIPTIFDLLKSALEERVQQGVITMSKGRFMTMAGPLTILVGALWLIACLGDIMFRIGLKGNEAFLGLIALPFFLFFVPMVFALIGIRFRFYQFAGSAGKFGLLLSVTGGAGIIVSLLTNILLSGLIPEAGPHLWVNYAAVFSVLSIRIGFILFGVDAQRYRLLPRWNLLPLLLGLTVVLSLPLDWFGVPAFLSARLATPFLHFAITGVCWLLFGITMLDQRRESQPTAVI
ncbi:MAG: hypothetical protein H6667_00755 [Ardenticatenaceae bacterium]|nr:hypothetical protein [Ardenticatenaceae bacterium]